MRIYVQHIEVKLSILEYPARETPYEALVNSLDRVYSWCKVSIMK